MAKKKKQRERYAPVEEWQNVPEQFKKLLLKNGEFTTIVDPHTGMGLCIIARVNNSTRFHYYLDGVEFAEDFKRVTLIELNEREKENEKFL